MAGVGQVAGAEGAGGVGVMVGVVLGQGLFDPEVAGAKAVAVAGAGE